MGVSDGFACYSSASCCDTQADGKLRRIDNGRASRHDEATQCAERFGMNKRIRDVEQGPDGAIWLLEDGRRGSGHLMKLTALNNDP